MSNFKRRLECLERRLQAVSLAGRDRKSCPECRNFDEHFGSLGIRYGNACPGHPQLTPDQAKAEYDRAFRELCASLGIAVGDTPK